MGDMSLPPDYPTVPVRVYDEAKLVKLVRQIAMGIKDLPDVLFDNDLTMREFDEIKQLPSFGKMLAAEIKAWEGADNTVSRVRLKTAAMLEEYLPELYARLNDRDEPLMAKIKAIELMGKMAQVVGDKDTAVINPGDKVHVIINLGGDANKEYIKQLPHKVIEHEAPPAQPAIEEPSLEQIFAESLDASAN